MPCSGRSSLANSYSCCLCRFANMVYCILTLFLPLKVNAIFIIVVFVFACFGGQHWVFIAVHRLSLVAASRGYSLVAVRGLLTAVASLVEHGL